MKILYITLSNNDEARIIGQALLEKKLANCVNYFPITCIYNYEGEITEEPEVVLIVKTIEDKYEQIKDVIKQEINYDNFIGQINIEKVNDDFENWLCSVLNSRSLSKGKPHAPY